MVNNHVRGSFPASGLPPLGIGGAVYGGNGTTVHLVGCLAMNCSADEGGGVHLSDSSEVESSIFWNNSDRNGMVGASQVVAPTVRYSCVMNMLVGVPGGSVPNPADFPGSFDLDPLLNPLTFELMAGSPCIDAADNLSWDPATLTDLRGRPRFVDDPLAPNTGIGPGPIADMGPLERQ